MADIFAPRTIKEGLLVLHQEMVATREELTHLRDIVEEHLTRNGSDIKELRGGMTELMAWRHKAVGAALVVVPMCSALVGLAVRLVAP